MSKLLLTLLLALFIIPLQSQTLNIKIDNGNDINNLQVDIPINGFKTRGINRKYYNIYSERENTIAFNTKTDGVFSFSVAGIGFELILFPKDSISMSINIDGKNLSIIFSGSNNKGHELWLEVDRPKPQKFLAIYEELKNQKYLENSYQLVTEHADSLSNLFTDLYRNGSITKEFLDAASHYLRDDLGGSFFEFIALRYKDNWSRLEYYFKKYLAYMDAYNSQYIQYSYWCIDWYMADKYIAETDKKNYHKTYGIYGHLELLPEGIMESKAASTIAFEASSGSDDINWKNAHQYFNNQFPKSNFKPYLDKFVEPYYNRSNIPTDSIYYIDSKNNYKTIKNLANNQFKDSFVFIDLWATWCAPCRAEFSHSHSLHNFLNKHGIESLYISIDKDNMDNTWKKTVEHMGLKGSHIRNINSLYYNIWEQVYGEEQFTIPRYLLVGKDGEILDNNLPRPSSNDILKNRILELIR